MREPDISCVIPAFNDRVHLPRAVRSALSQEGVQVEVLIVDDCSDSATREFIENLAAADPRIRPFLLSRNGGQSEARNIGAALARGRFIAFLDQDDEHEPGWYRTALHLLRERPALAAISGRARVVDIPARLGVAEDDLRLENLTNVFATNIVFRTSVFRASGGFPTGGVWRTPAAGEDSAYRHGIAHNWAATECAHPALIHHAREHGATVHYLERSEVRNGEVVITRMDDIEASGQLQAAFRQFTERFAAISQELRACSAAVW